MKILLVNLPINGLKQNHTDYPYFYNYYLIFLASILKKNNYCVELKDSFSQANSNCVFDTISKTYSLGDIYYDYDLISDNYDKILVINHPYLNINKPSMYNFYNKIFNQLKTKCNQLIIADCFVSGMSFLDYDENSIIINYPQIDVVLKGSINNVLQYFKLNDIKLNEYIIDFDLINLENYINFLKQVKQLNYYIDDKFKVLPLLTSFGCVYNCKFCTSCINNQKYLTYDLKVIEELLKKLYLKHGINKIIFFDDLLNSNENRLHNLVKIMNKYDVKYDFANGLRADKIGLQSLELMKLKVTDITVSLETGNKYYRNNYINKHINESSFFKLAENCKKLGICLKAHYMYGLPFENIELINETIEFAFQIYEKYNVYPLIQKYEYFPNKKVDKNDINDLNYDLIDKIIKTKFNQITYSNPYKIIINTTYKCNNNCKFCAVSNLRLNEPDLEYQKNEILKFKKLSDSIDFDGGEPTLNNNTLKLVYFAKQNGFNNISITTNARLLSNFKLAQMYAKSPLNNILVSLHGLNDIHNNIVMNKNAFEQTVKGIKNLLQLKNNFKFNLLINITLSKYNISQLDELIQYIYYSLNIKNINIQGLTPFGSAEKKMLLEESDYVILENIIRKYFKRIKFNIVNIPFCKLNVDIKYFFDDMGKNRREMLFIGMEKENLADFLLKKRTKTKKCNSCYYKTICKGEWDFD